MNGKDGRFYDDHYDFNHDGKLDMYEYTLMEEDVFGSPKSSFDFDDDDDDDDYDDDDDDDYDEDEDDEDED